MYEKRYQSRVLKQNQNVTIKKEPWLTWKRFLIFIVVVVFLSGVVYLIKQPKLQITNINVVGTSVLDEQDLSNSVHDQLLGRRLWIFPRTSFFLINTRSISHVLKKQFPRIESVTIKATDFHTLEVKIKEFGPAYLWCRATDQDCYFMDSKGVVYSSAPIFSGTAYPKIFTGASLMDLPFLGIKQADLSQIVQIEKQLSEINITPVNFRDVSNHELQIDFLHNKNIAELIIDPSISTDTSMEYLFSGIRTEPLMSLFHDTQKVLLYIDVRFPNKVVYKFQ